MSYFKHIILAVIALFLVAPDAAVAQRSSGWKFERDDTEDFVGAGGCAAENCLYLVCRPKMPDSLAWELTGLPNNNREQKSRVAWHVDDGIIVFPMYRNESFGSERQGYDAYFNPNNPYSSLQGPSLAQSHALLQALRRENSITVDGGFPTFNLSLRGSNRALTQLLAECPFAGEADAAAIKAAVLGWDAPFEAVDALAAKQGCIITQEEIHDAMMWAGAHIWDFNQFVVNGSQNGTLTLIDEENSVYRLAGCIPQ